MVEIKVLGEVAHDTVKCIKLGIRDVRKLFNITESPSVTVSNGSVLVSGKPVGGTFGSPDCIQIGVEGFPGFQLEEKYIGYLVAAHETVHFKQYLFNEYPNMFKFQGHWSDFDGQYSKQPHEFEAWEISYELFNGHSLWWPKIYWTIND